MRSALLLMVARVTAGLTAGLAAGLAAVLVGAAGCDPAPMLAPGATAVAFVRADTLTPILDGAPGPVIHGPQGGYHILVSLLAHGVWPGTPGSPGGPDQPICVLQAFHADGREVSLAEDDTLKVAWTPVEGGVAILDQPLRLDISSPSQVASERLLLRATLTDRDSRRATDEKHVIAIPTGN